MDGSRAGGPGERDDTASGRQPDWPDGKRFAFTIFDDTDLARPGNFESVYALLRDLGMRTTKSVWAVRGEGVPTIGGATCEDPDYLAAVLRLQGEGFEIGSHGASHHGLERAEIESSLDQFRRLFGTDPPTFANHADAADSIYWGDARLDGPYRLAYRLLTRGHNRDRYTGHVPSSRRFWGDLCASRVRYVRSFTTGDINTLRACPWMPYHDPRRPYVAAWFMSTEGPSLPTFVNAISEEAQDRLEEEGGACVMYTHFAKGFQTDGQVDRRFRELMERLARKPGWFVPVATLLDHLASRNGIHQLTDGERSGLQRRWLMHKIRLGGTS